MLVPSLLLIVSFNLVASLLMLSNCRRRHAAAVEYQRAYNDYQSLVDHRIGNPLTVIGGAAHTLLAEDLALSEDERRALLASIVEQSERIQHISLSPRVRLGVEERCLHAMPRRNAVVSAA